MSVMRRKLIAPVVIFALGAVLGASCTRSAEGQLPTPEMISDVLPTITDMPGEWDESVSWVQKTTPPPATQSEKMESVSRTTIARFGSIVMAMQLGDVAFTGSAVAMDEDEWWSIVELAGEKLGTLDSQVRR